MGKNLLLWLIIGITMVSLFNMFNPPLKPGEGMTYSAFIQKVDGGMVDTARIKEHEVSGQYRNLQGDLRTYQVTIPNNDPGLTQRLIDNHVEVDVSKPEEVPFLLSVLISWFPMLLLIAVWVFFMRQMQGGGRGGAMSFGKSKAKLLTQNTNKVTFSDVAGCDEAKQEVTEVIEFLRDPSKFTRLGGKIPKGVLLVGPPGTGKTLLARAIAGEADVPFFSISGSDFVEMFVGVGASRVRDMFEQAKKSAPCIIFVDEIDAMGRHRGAGIGGGNDEREQTLNQMLVEMDGFEANEGVILVAATNRPDVLDPALLRPGRFDRQVVVPRPDLKGREEILRVHMRKVPLSSDVEVKSLARGTPGFSGADLANLVNEAALNAARFGADRVGNADFETAKDKVMMGTERRSMIISDDQKKTTAYHEAGHTLVAKYLKTADPVHKVSIIPRGQALGVTMQLPVEDRFNHDAEYLKDQIAIMMGGRLGEELVLSQKTTGASNDFERATQLARNMVTQWGMSDELGPMVYGEREHEPFLGREITRQTNISEETARKIDAVVRKMVDDNYNRAKDILVEHMDQLHMLALALIEYETLDGPEIDTIMAGKALHRGEPRQPKTPPQDPSAAAPETGTHVPTEEAGQHS
ncbi:MAG: cell division protein FtsH [Zetaproteobacteria bacterium CG06_land_8_20_14_3_00_59_53]|nr:MAG: cell division protein FtsH [Zetaproteobacteria bacterium CG2_30_59_37]PIO90885.1 MAG: cell division protein FtsH [Zetaproteobacteria bacterium CG23_combo_of_CG06-09_8_20_14_all_59_86]PIQ64722.1 MAG: cell division protein FtsH [Zetaproteobacteria bacterium CG11_big_fil_rev_8_21_14_0_20_59_439]PIU71195.1 MAG: cell division protein FtsH [Zetaproteobacteria bacterium CG06_land_8_20_14_3_00_59_53]PIU96689.1 MAG: cell division protein FtsH [Zetaproteobacteria bacterium CG03_land_8_20_14_0_80_